MNNIDLKFYFRLLKYSLVKIRFLFKKNLSLGRFVYLGRRVNLHSNVTIGDCSYIGQYSFIASNVTIGNFALFSDNVNIIGNDHLFDIPGVPIILSGIPKQVKTLIGDDVWLGHAATIMRGVTIGNGSIVASNSVVTKNIPPYEIWAGIPAKKIKNRYLNESQNIKHETFLSNYRKGIINLKHDRKIESFYE
jgi:acetyltransferase-like isoleucine patch superfamily enzyme